MGFVSKGTALFLTLQLLAVTAWAEEPLDIFEVSTQDKKNLSGRKYLLRQEEIESDIRRDRNRRKRSPEWEINLPLALEENLESFSVRLERKGDVSLEERRSFEFVPGVLGAQLDLDRDIYSQPFTLSEYLEYETGNLAQDLLTDRKDNRNFSPYRPRNLSGTVSENSSTNVLSEDVETEANRFLWELFYSGKHDTKKHPGEGMLEE